MQSCGAICSTDHAEKEDRDRARRTFCFCALPKGHPGPHDHQMCERVKYDRLMDLIHPIDDRPN